VGARGLGRRALGLAALPVGRSLTRPEPALPLGLHWNGTEPGPALRLAPRAA